MSRKLLAAFTLSFAMLVGFFSTSGLQKAEAATWNTWSTKPNYSYYINATKSDTAINTINHGYSFDWMFPTGGGNLKAITTFKLRTNGTLQLANLKPDATMVWPFYLKSSSSKIVTSSGSGVNGINYYTVGWSPTEPLGFKVGGTSPYSMNVSISKVSQITNGWTLLVKYNATGRDDIK